MKEARFEFYKKQLILGEVVEMCSGSKLSGLHFYFAGVFEDFSHFFPICSKHLLKFLKSERSYFINTFS